MSSALKTPIKNKNGKKDGALKNRSGKKRTPFSNSKKYKQSKPYPRDMKSTYIEHYPPKEGERRYAGGSKIDFSPIRSAQKTRANPDNYDTNYKKEYVPHRIEKKSPIPKSKYRQPKGDFRDDTEYKQGTGSPKKMNYSPVKREKQRAKQPSKFNEKTQYEVDYPGHVVKPQKIDNDAFRQTSPFRQGRFNDKTDYKDNYIPHPIDEADRRREQFRPIDNTSPNRNQRMENKSLYKKDYIPQKVQPDRIEKPNQRREPKRYPKDMKSTTKDHHEPKDIAKARQEPINPPRVYKKTRANPKDYVTVHQNDYVPHETRPQEPIRP